MKYIDEYRDKTAIDKLCGAINQLVTRDYMIMELCGGQTHSIMRFGLDQLLPDGVNLIHGPGCPVCVTPQKTIDEALAIAENEDVVFCSFGDMLRVPGTSEDLLSIRAKKGNVKIVYSPVDAVRVAQSNPDKEVVFFAVGFETTAPTTAMAIYLAHKEQLDNFSVLTSHVRVPPAMEKILDSEENQVEGFLAAGHVCAIMGTSEYEPIANKYKTPIVITGFEPLDLLEGIYLCLLQLEKGQSQVQNQYVRAVTREGNKQAKELMVEVFEPVDYSWRGLGIIADSGLKINEKYQRYDARSRFSLTHIESIENENCISGLILQGLEKPLNCPLFGKECNPENPIGVTMVASEGVCAAYYRYRFREQDIL